MNRMKTPRQPSGNPDLLDIAVAAFRSLHPEYAEPIHAAERCRKASGEFCSLLIALGAPRTSVCVDEIAIVDGVCHYGALFRGVAVDFTARQFSPDAPWPVILRPGETWSAEPPAVVPTFDGV